MAIQVQIKNYITSLHEPKRSELENLHQLIKNALPSGDLWFSDGKNAAGKIVANPNIGYGRYTIKYANGTSKDFFRIGLSANKNGLSVYILGLADKTYLSKTYGETLGKASITGYCIKFKKLQDIQIDVLLTAIKYGYTCIN
jgi:Domain of unknown function (DU1801)